jgi:hypothetical protein
VVQLQTNFGGGKTHSMLALYHLFSNATPGELVGIDEVLKEAGVARPAKSEPGGSCRKQDLAGKSRHKVRRNGGSYPLGRAGLAIGICCRGN